MRKRRETPRKGGNEEFIFEKIADILSEKGLLYFDLYVQDPSRGAQPPGLTTQILGGKYILTDYFQDAHTSETYESYISSNDIVLDERTKKFLSRCVHKPIFWKDTPLGLSYINTSNKINVPHEIRDLYLKLKKKTPS